MKHKSLVRVVTENPNVFASGVSGKTVYEALEDICAHQQIDMAIFGWAREDFDAQVFQPKDDADQSELAE